MEDPFYVIVINEMVMSKQNEKTKEVQQTISVCDIMKENTSEVIKKMEYQIPTFVQLYSDLYTEYLHSMEDLFGTCYIAEKQFYDKMGIDQKTLRSLDSYWKAITKTLVSQIEMSTNFQKAYVQTRIAGIKAFDEYMHLLMDYYAKVYQIELNPTYKP